MMEEDWSLDRDGETPDFEFGSSSRLTRKYSVSVSAKAAIEA